MKEFIHPRDQLYSDLLEFVQEYQRTYRHFSDGRFADMDVLKCLAKLAAGVILIRGWDAKKPKNHNYFLYELRRYYKIMIPMRIDRHAFFHKLD